MWRRMLNSKTTANLEHRFNAGVDHGAGSGAGSIPLQKSTSETQIVGSGMFEQLPSPELVDQLYGNERIAAEPD